MGARGGKIIMGGADPCVPLGFRGLEADLARAQADHPKPSQAEIRRLLAMARLKLAASEGRTPEDEERLQLTWFAIVRAERGLS